MKEFIIISGLSGAGKSKAASFLEDVGFYCVDNMPVVLIPKFAEICMAGGGQYERVALVTDVRGGRTFDELFSMLDTLKSMDCPYKLLFVEASEETLINRYKETRRKHPLAGDEATLQDSVRREKEILTPVRAKADYIIDTTAMSTSKLMGEIIRLFLPEQHNKTMSVSVISFGFKYGIPIEADLVFDVRFLPNPYYIEDLRCKTGLDKDVISFLLGYQQTKDFIRHLENMIGFLLPHYLEEGKTALVIAIGCTGGRHRSVTITKVLADFIRQRGFEASENHRDMTR
jgi:UPF0042 nucleotide-binding protein